MTTNQAGGHAEEFPPPDFSPDDFIVHDQRGIGIFRGLQTIPVPAGEPGKTLDREFLVLEYRDAAKVYLPPDQIAHLFPYSGGDEENPPELDRVDGQGWAKTLARVRGEVVAVAEELLNLYAERSAASGYACGPDTQEQRTMEAAFPYEETPDQIAAINEIKRDLETPRPMDRLLIGDVGYGKTEVALRAAFKVAHAGRQVVVLCPTSVLAAQHYQTFSERLAPSGIRVARLSRLVPADEQKTTLERLKTGEIDIVIGTHRLLSSDVAFTALGLVIIDEEQRFGVAHKEALKQFRKTVDVLSMTATPIPRTLDMALAGVRDLSVIADPPSGRAPIETRIVRFSDAVVQEAIVQELARQGQVYYLSNTISSLEATAERLRTLVPTARIGIAHGQMEEDALEEAMTAFYEHRSDVLVCTTVIETGLDIANANTILIEDADKLGLAQLHQLRGRVGRSDRQAHALLLYSEDEVTPAAGQRLQTLQRFTEPGAGYEIARRDLQLRGAGSMLGFEQSGSAAIRAVGQELYLTLLDEALHQQKGVSRQALPTLDLPQSVVLSSIPADYIPDIAARLRLYERAASAKTGDALDALFREIAERYGPLPTSVEGFRRLTTLRLQAAEAGIASIAYHAGQTTVLLQDGNTLSVERITALQSLVPGKEVTVNRDRVLLASPPEAVFPLLEQVVLALLRVL